MDFDKDGRLIDPNEGLIERLWRTKAGRVLQVLVIGSLLVLLAYGFAGSLLGGGRGGEDACTPTYYNDC